MQKESKIAMDLINNGYDILDKKIYYVGGGVVKGADTYIDLNTVEYVIEPYEYVEHGGWKLKFNIKKRK